MDESGNRVADYFVIAGLPPDPADQTLSDEGSLVVSLKPSHNQEWDLVFQIYVFKMCSTSTYPRATIR